MITHLDLPHGRLELPVYLPDATYGYVRSLDSQDLLDCGIEAVVMNAFHLMLKPGSTVVKKLGGLHAMYGWERPIVTDSGGFQAYSMIRKGAGRGGIGRQGIVFHPQGSERKVLLTPEKSVRLQVNYGADIALCLDDCTHASDASSTRESVDRTIAWARECRGVFDRLGDDAGWGNVRPLLFGVVQGGADRAQRRRCAEVLLEIGFDGLGFGGYPLDKDGTLLEDMLAYVRELAPADKPLFALGIGHPAGVAACVKLGYGIFDCSLPTRDARQGRLYAVTTTFSPLRQDAAGWFSFSYIEDERHSGAKGPVCEGCDCLACRRYSAGFLHHLKAQEDPLYMRLATIHNLRTMARVMAAIRGELAEGSPAGRISARMPAREQSAGRRTTTAG